VVGSVRCTVTVTGANQQMTNTEEKANFEVKDFISLAFSAIALVVSFGTAYFSVLRVEEHVSVIIKKEPVAYKSADGNSLYVKKSEEGQFLFVNSGNRPAVVLWMEIIFGQPTAPKAKPNCFAAGVARFRPDFSPIVIKPNDVAVAAIRIGVPHKFLTTDLAPKESGETFVFTETGGTADDVLVDECLEVAIAAPSTSMSVSTFPIMRYHVAKGHWYWRSGGDEGPLVHEPKMLVSKTYTIFNY
jgi:hypothetical protein